MDLFRSCKGHTLDRAVDLLYTRRYRKCKLIGPDHAWYVLTSWQYAIYMATIDYMVAAYGPYAASATGGNGFARDFLAGIAAMYSTPFYELFKTDTLEWPSTILAFIAAVVAIPVYVFYYKGEWFRERSPFAQTLSGERQENAGRRASKAVLGEEEREKIERGGEEEKIEDRADNRV